MKTHQIAKHIERKINDFTEHIHNQKVREIILRRAYITGGCIPSLMRDERVSDYDMYLFHKEDVETVKKYYEDILNNNATKPDKYYPAFISDNAINLSHGMQIMLKWYGTPKEVVNDFDFEHIKSYWMEGEIHINPKAYQLINDQVLVYTGSSLPLSSLMRVMKYSKKGWYCSVKTFLHILFDVFDAFGLLNQNDAFLFTEYVRDIEAKGEEADKKPVEEYFDDWRIAKTEDSFNSGNREIDLRTLIRELNGVDPFTVQNRLESYLRNGQVRMNIDEILSLIQNDYE